MLREDLPAALVLLPSWDWRPGMAESTGLLYVGQFNDAPMFIGPELSVRPCPEALPDFNHPGTSGWLYYLLCETLREMYGPIPDPNIEHRPTGWCVFCSRFPALGNQVAWGATRGEAIAAALHTVKVHQLSKRTFG